jgi:hypothetical protein
LRPVFVHFTQEIDNGTFLVLKVSRGNVLEEIGNSDLLHASDEHWLRAPEGPWTRFRTHSLGIHLWRCRASAIRTLWHSVVWNVSVCKGMD